MSNTSYSFKENSHAIVNQGGEKKVMKKILSVALSTAMAFSMFASVAFGADAKLTPEQQFNALKEAGIVSGFPDGLSHLEQALTRAELAKIIVNSLSLEPVNGVATYKDKGYSANHWAAPYIEAATQAKILEGSNGLFRPSDKVTVQELAKVLVTALKLEVPADANNTASAWAKGYVAAAVEKGFIPEGINYQAQATRSQAVVAAYALYEANQVPTVKSYKVVDPKNVEVTMSNDEIVKVALEKALEANKETEIKFTYKDKEYTHKVTYVTTVAQAVKSVSAADLKQIVVTFDGSVDAKSAELASNYSVKDRTFESAKLSADKTSVTLLLDEASTLTNQKEFELSINNVKNEDSTKTFSQKVKFTPVDVTTPTIKEVTGLGTKAVKIKFSEPVQRGEATKSVNYKVDGKAIGASIVYSYPDTVILSTNLSEGDHKISVSNVADFSGLKVVPVDYDFTATVDTAAPEVVTATSKDLTEVTVEFNEPVKAVNSAYANVSGNTGIVKVSDNKVIITFVGDKKLNYSENTIYLKGVRDYSDNAADREVKVNPTLDTVRPEVLSYELKNENGNYVAKVKFSEALKASTVEDRSNYVLKNSEGKEADKGGTDSKGNPIAKPTFDSKNNIVTIILGNDLGNSAYTLTISGLQDNAYVANTMVPYTIDLDAAKAQQGAINRAWLEPVTGGQYVYVEFNKALATSGAGDASDFAKYTWSRGSVSQGQLAEEAGDVVVISADTVRIFTKKAITVSDSVQASYVANVDGDYFMQGNGYVLSSPIKTQAIQLTKATATSTTELKLEFDGKLNYVDYQDFRVVSSAAGAATYVPTSYSLSSDSKTLYLKFEGTGRELPADVETSSYYVTTFNDNSQDAYGNAVDLTTSIPAAKLVDDVAPKLVSNGLKIAATSTTATYTATLTFTEAVDTTNGVTFPGGLEGLFKVKVAGTDATVTTVGAGASTNVLVVTFTYPAVINPTDEVKFEYTADYTKAITDTSAAKKNLSSFTVNELYEYID